MADRASGEYQLFNLRLPVETLSRLHRYRDYLNQTQPGIDANVSMAARMLLFRALDQVRRRWEFARRRRPGSTTWSAGRSDTSHFKAVPEERAPGEDRT